MRECFATLPFRPVVAIDVAMNLRLPLALAVVAVAAGAAALHSGRHDPAPFATNAPLAAAVAAPSVEPRPTRKALPPEPATRVTVYVAGDVARPGVFALPTGSRAVDALHAAGGAAPDADPVAVNLAEPLLDGEEIVVPRKGSNAAVEADAAAAGSPDNVTPSTAHRHRAKHRHKHRKHHAHHHTTSSSTDAAPPTTSDASADTDAPTQTVDLNTADENELETLPGIGASLASRIVSFRQINGPFTSPDDLLDVGGMTQSRLDAITPYVTTP